jgi:hypothetical protein
MGGVKKGSQRIQTSQSRNAERKLPKLPAGCPAATVSVFSTSLPPSVTYPFARLLSAKLSMKVKPLGDRHV